MFTYGEKKKKKEKSPFISKSPLKTMGKESLQCFGTAAGSGARTSLGLVGFRAVTAAFPQTILPAYSISNFFLAEICYNIF